MTEGPGVDHLRLVMGTSLRVVQTSMWGVRYPDLMDALVPPRACRPRSRGTAPRPPSRRAACAPHPLSLVRFRYAPAGTAEAEREAENARIMHAVNASGGAFLSHTKLGERYVLRLAIGNIRTERRHVARAWELLRDASERAMAAASP